MVNRTHLISRKSSQLGQNVTTVNPLILRQLDCRGGFCGPHPCVELSLSGVSVLFVRALAFVLVLIVISVFVLVLSLLGFCILNAALSM